MAIKMTTRRSVQALYIFTNFFIVPFAASIQQAGLWNDFEIASNQTVAINRPQELVKLRLDIAD